MVTNLHEEATEDETMPLSAHFCLILGSDEVAGTGEQVCVGKDNYIILLPNTVYVSVWGEFLLHGVGSNGARRSDLFQTRRYLGKPFGKDLSSAFIEDN